jgi:hypothetical protein
MEARDDVTSSVTSLAKKKRETFLASGILFLPSKKTAMKSLSHDLRK